MPDFEGVSQETVDSIREQLAATQEEQNESTLGMPTEAPEEPQAPTPEAPAAPAEEAPEERVAGQEGTVRGNPLQGVMDAVGGAANALAENMEGGRVNILDFVDNTFQGDQKTKEEIAAERKGQREEYAAKAQEAQQQMLENDPVGAAVADTLVRAVPGGAIDALEDTLGAAEVIGDTVKTFATLGNVHESQNPFSSNYDWAQWKLGADEIGAKTPVGQFAQELVSFAAIGSRLGAFKSFQGGIKGATKAQTAANVLKAGGAEALYGMATDAIKGLAGEGNFANMLETLIPGLKDTWVTALAVDQDDNPWESAVKSALDGAAIGFPVGIIGAVASATRAVKNLPVEQQADKFAEVFAEQVKQTELPLGVRLDVKSRELPAHEVAMEMQDGNFSRIDQVSDDAIRELVDQRGYDINAFNEDPKAFSNALGFHRQMSIFGEGTITKKLRNGSEIDWSITKLDQAAEDSPYRIDWDISGVDAEASGLGEGGAGVEMFKQVKEVVRDADLPPGTIIETEAAKDGFGHAGRSEAQIANATKAREAQLKEAKKIFLETEEGATEDAWRVIGQPEQGRRLKEYKEKGLIKEADNIRSKLYKRAGFSEPDADGIIRGIVKADKSGRKVFQPLDVDGDVAAQIAAAKSTGATQLSLPALDVVADRVKAGVPVYWDDVAETVPEMFTPGTRVIENPEFPREVLNMLRDPGDGVTVNPFTGEVPPTGTMVAIDGKSLTSFEPEAVSDFIAQNYDILTREDVFLGGWISDITGKPVVELSRRVENFEEALALGKAFDQEGVFRMDDFSYHETGGIDRLKETQGYHLKSAYTTKNYVRTPGDAQSIAAKQFTPGAPNGAIGGRIMTDEQLHILGDSMPEYASRQLDELVRDMDVRADDVVADSRITHKELWTRVSDDISDFIDEGGRLDINKLPTIKYGDDSILTREGALQARVLIQNIAGTVWDEARQVSMKDGQGIDSATNMEVMIDGLKGLLRMRKKTVNLFGTRLADEGMKLQRPSLFESVFTPSAAAKKAEEAKLFNMKAGEMDAVEKALDDMVEGMKSGDSKRIRQAKRTAQFLELTGGDPTKLVRVAKGLPGLYADVALKHMYNSLLSSPATHLVNNMSNFINTAARPLQAALGGQGKAAAASFYNFGEMLSESWDLAARTWNEEAIAQGSKVAEAGETRIALDQLAERVQMGTATNAERLSSGFLHVMYDLAEHPALAWPSKFLTTSDEFFKAMNSRMEFRVQNYLEAANTADGNPDVLFRELMAKNKDLAFGKKTGAVMDSQLLDVAKELTFQTSLEGPAGTFARLVDDLPFLRPFFPFVKTGHNIMVFTGTHTPILNLALGESRRALRGDLGPYAQAVHRGRLAMGSMVMMSGGLALANGTLTGSGPPPGPRRDAWTKSHEPHSIKVGDRWINYSRIEPFGQILSAMADTYEAMTTGELEAHRGEYRMSYLMYAISANISNKTFFQGIKDISVLLNPSGAGVLGKLETIALGTANNFVPAAGLRRATSNAFTPYMMEYHRASDRHRRQMGLPHVPAAPVIDPLDGQPIMSSSGGFGNAITPIKTVTRGTDAVRDALEVIEFEQGEVKKELGDIDLTPEQSGRLNELMAESGLYAAIEDIVNKKGWAQAVKEHKQAVQDGTSNVDKTQMLYYKMIKETWARHQKIALNALLEEDGELMFNYYSNKITTENARRGQIEGLLQMPNR